MGEKSKIAIIAHGISNGGAERVAINLANYHCDEFDVLYIAVFDGRKGYEIDDRVKVIKIETTKSSAIGKLCERNIDVRNAAKEFGAEIVLSFLTNESLLVHLSGIPMVYSLRNDPANIDKTIVKRIIRYYEYSHAKKIVFQSQGAREYFSKRIQERGVIIANPVKCDSFPNWAECEHEDRFITACRLTKQKNIPMLIRAFQMFHKEHGKFSLEIYGSGGDEITQLINNIISENNCENYIKLMGYEENIHETMAHSSCFVLSSDYEGVSNAMLEALAIGVPCICTDCPPGGAREYIEDGKNGLLVSVGNAEEMCEAMCRVIEDEKLALSLSQNAVLIRERIGYSVVCSQWKEVLNNAVGKS
jgi:glycosyltransferase involved in cell wall biosynthesis